METIIKVKNRNACRFTYVLLSVPYTGLEGGYIDGHGVLEIRYKYKRWRLTRNLYDYRGRYRPILSCVTIKQLRYKINRPVINYSYAYIYS